MAAYLTLIDGSIWFPYGIEREQNVIHPHQWQAQMFLCKHSGHVSVDPLHKNFGRNLEFPPDLKPYYLAEHSLRLVRKVEEYLEGDYDEDLLLEALCFNCHKIYPPGDKYSPELSEKGQSKFDQLHILKNRRLVKSNSILIRKSLGLSIKVDELLIELNKQIQANELFYLQHKTDEELHLMKLPSHTEVYDFNTNKYVEKLIPLDSQQLTYLWWKKFIEFGGWEAFDSNKRNLTRQDYRDLDDE